MRQLLLWGMHRNIDFNAEKNLWAGVSCVIQEEKRGQLATNLLLPLFLQELNQFSCLNGVAEKHKLSEIYFPPHFKFPSLNKFHTLPTGRAVLEISMNWSSPGQQKSKNFHLMNITHIKIRFLMEKKSSLP